MPGFGFKEASSHVKVCVLSVLSSTWTICSIRFFSCRERSAKTSPNLMIAGYLLTYGDTDHTVL
jgi:hypothetical protein